jgi:hypothetical protein
MSKYSVAKIQEITKEEFEHWTGDTITDSQWEAIADDIVGRAENYIDELLELVIQDYKEGTYDE